MKKLLILLFSIFFLSSPSFGGGVCPKGTWNRNQSTAMYGGMSTAMGGGLSTAMGGGLSTAMGGGLSTGIKPYCTNRPHLHTLIEMGIIDSNYNLLR